MIRHISKIEVCEAYHLALAVPLPDGLHVVIEDYMPFTMLPMVGLATVEVSDEVSNRLRIWTTKVSVTLPTRMEQLTHPLVFRLTDVCGRCYLVGTSELPFPKINFTDKFPERASGTSACTMTITWKAPLAMMEIIDRQ
ncbi:MAG: hypothetical protein J6B92_08140 [Paraprevotella sp.]|nr:hypothetical protein [Paraprevotella sp.]